MTNMIIDYCLFSLAISDNSYDLQTVFKYGVYVFLYRISGSSVSNSNSQVGCITYLFSDINGTGDPILNMEGIIFSYCSYILLLVQ